MHKTTCLVHVSLHIVKEIIHLFGVLQQLTHTLSERSNHIFNVARLYFPGEVLFNIVDEILCNDKSSARKKGASFDAQFEFDTDVNESIDGLKTPSVDFRIRRASAVDGVSTGLFKGLDGLLVFQ